MSLPGTASMSGRYAQASKLGMRFEVGCSCEYASITLFNSYKERLLTFAEVGCPSIISAKTLPVPRDCEMPHGPWPVDSGQYIILGRNCLSRQTRCNENSTFPTPSRREAISKLRIRHPKHNRWPSRRNWTKAQALPNNLQIIFTARQAQHPFRNLPQPPNSFLIRV